MSNKNRNDFNDFSEKFDELIDNNELNIGSIEDLMINSINNFFSIINFDYANTLYEKIKEI